MQINSTTTVPFVPINTGTSVKIASASPEEVESQPVLQLSSPTFAALVQEAKSYPEVRSEVVAAYAAQVATGHYPSTDVMSGLADLFSGGISD